jgi:hypothetical protein
MSECTLCRAPGGTRHLDLYVIGSEGIRVCHDCEMILVRFCESLKGVAGRAEKKGFKIGRGLHKNFTN